MDVHDRIIQLAGRDTLFRPIEFERYRKPHVVEYPRLAIVLNPQHSWQQQQQHRAKGGDGALPNTSDDEADGNRRRGADDEDEDADDPRCMPREEYLCSDDALAKVMHLKWNSVGPVGAGLVNVGNTCFANSVLQAIAYTPALAQLFANAYRTPDGQLGAPYDFAYALGETIRQVHLGRTVGSSGGAYRPGRIVGHLRALSTHFTLGRQSDAHEFAVQLLLGCQKSLLYRLVGSKKLSLRVTYTTALFRICGGYLRSQVRWSCLDEIQQLRKAGKRQEANDLEIEMKNRRRNRDVHCSRAQNLDHMVSNTYDPTNMIHVDIAGQTLEHCLARFCEPEKLHGRCYHSPRDVAVIATKQMLIHIPPNVLMIHLKRFTPTGGKAGKYIKYPVQLNLRPYCTGNSGRDHSGNDTAASPIMYELNAVCVHEGGSINYGHYYAIVRARNGAWYECNDSSVTPIGQDRALGQQAYMLFYSRVPSAPHRASGSAGIGTDSGNISHGQKTQSTAGTHYRPHVGVEAALEPIRTSHEELAVGKELGEEELAALLARRAASRSALAAPVTKDAKAEGENQKPPRPEQKATPTSLYKNKLAPGGDKARRQALKRMRADLSTDEDGDSAGSPGGEPVGPQHSENAGEDSSAPADDAQSKPELAAHTRPPIGKSCYGGLVKAMRVNPATPLRRAQAARSAPSDSGGSRDYGNTSATQSLNKEKVPVTRALGRAAVITLAQKKQEAEPETVRRDSTAPKFQQRVEDAMWEMEMDKGRVKKVKRKHNDEGVVRDASGAVVNRFQQKSRSRFDIRGRRLADNNEGE